MMPKDGYQDPNITFTHTHKLRKKQLIGAPEPGPPRRATKFYFPHYLAVSASV
jgi:hypothetical protein